MKKSSRLPSLLPRAACAFVLGALAAGTALAQQIVLSPSSVIGSSPSSDGGTNTTNWNANTYPYTAGTIFSQQSGSVSGSAGSWANNTWFPAASIGGTYATVDNRYVVIDLGGAYTLSSIQIFNGTATYQHTGTFALRASNSITAASNEGGFTRGQTLLSPVTLIGSTALNFTNNENPVTGQSFSISDTTAYRYLQIDLLTAAGSLNGGVMDIRGSSLSEVRINGVSAIPEPSTYAAMAGAAMLGLAVWRRRNNRPAVEGTR